MEAGTVLIIDDDDSLRELYKEAFTAADFTVHTAANGHDGVDMALQHHPNIILMDVTMPGLDGHGAVSKIRKDEWGKYAKIMYLTNNIDTDSVVTAVQQQGDEYIVKSDLDPKEIVERARKLMYAIRPDSL